MGCPLFDFGTTLKLEICFGTFALGAVAINQDSDAWVPKRYRHILEENNANGEPRQLFVDSIQRMLFEFRPVLTPRQLQINL